MGPTGRIWIATWLILIFGGAWDDFGEKTGASVAGMACCHRTMKRPWPEAFGLLTELAECAAGIGSVSKKALDGKRDAGPVYRPVSGGLPGKS